MDVNQSCANSAVVLPYCRSFSSVSAVAHSLIIFVLKFERREEEEKKKIRRKEKEKRRRKIKLCLWRR